MTLGSGGDGNAVVTLGSRGEEKVATSVSKDQGEETLGSRFDRKAVTLGSRVHRKFVTARSRQHRNIRDIGVKM